MIRRDRANEHARTRGSASRVHRGSVYITLIIGLSGCPSKTGPDASVADAGAPIADAGAASEPVDAGPPQPAELGLIVTAQLGDGGVEVVSSEVDPVKSLDVWIPVVLPDYRLRVFDESDKVVPSDDQARETDGGIDYTISFVEPLRSGRTYRLTVEAQLGSALDGFKDAEVMMKVRGQLEPDKKPAKRKKR